MKYHDSWFEYYRKPFGAVKTDQKVDIWLSMPSDVFVQNARILVCNIDEWENPVEYPMLWQGNINGENRYHVQLKFADTITKFYYFKVNADGVDKTIKRDHDNKGILSNDIPQERYGVHWQITVYDKDWVTPPALKGTMYQIYPDRFFFSGEKKTGVSPLKILRDDWGALPEYRPDENNIIQNNDFFQGDLKGIMQKLPYIKSLGVTVIYLNPISKAYSNHGYDTGDYMEIDPIRGTKEDFVLLCKEAKKLGISIILDGVFSHTGDDSKYFNKYGRYDSLGAYQSKESKYFKWYKFKEYPNKYKSWWEIDILPEVDKSEPTFVMHIKDSIRQWISLGASGYRLDVADELPNSILDEVSKTVKEFGNLPVIVEVWEDASTKIAYGERKKYFVSRQADSTMNYPFKDAILNYVKYGNRETLYYAVMTILENYPKPVINGMMNLLGTHDSVRAITHLGGEEMQNDRVWQANHHYLDNWKYVDGKNKLKVSSIIQYFLPGMPSLYYGDEAGLTGYRDPFNRCCYPWGKEDKELLEHFKTIGKLRMENIDELFEADFNFVTVDQCICTFERIGKKASFFVAINRTNNDQQYLPVPEKYLEADIIYSMNNSTRHNLGAYGAIIMKKK